MLLIALSLLAGLAAGGAHVLSGPDHLAAVAPLAIRERGLPWLPGVWWGIGHSCGVWLLAAGAIAFRDWLPVALISTWSERFVGVVLIAIGAWALRRAALVGREIEADGPRAAAASHHHSALGIGTVHGLAGATHLLGVLPALVLPTRTGAVSYVAGFGIGSIVAMAAFAWLIGRITHFAGGARPHPPRTLWLASGVTAICIGACWIVSAEPVAH